MNVNTEERKEESEEDASSCGAQMLLQTILWMMSFPINLSLTSFGFGCILLIGCELYAADAQEDM